MKNISFYTLVTGFFLLASPLTSAWGAIKEINVFPPFEYTNALKLYLGGFSSPAQGSPQAVNESASELGFPKKLRYKIGEGGGFAAGLMIEDVAWLSIEGLYLKQGLKPQSEVLLTEKSLSAEVPSTLNTAGVALNAYYTAKLSPKLNFLAGGGVGYAYQEIKGIQNLVTTPLNIGSNDIKSRNTIFLQGKVGLVYQVLKHVMIYGAYKVINIPAGRGFEINKDSSTTNTLSATELTGVTPFTSEFSNYVPSAELVNNSVESLSKSALANKEFKDFITRAYDNMYKGLGLETSDNAKSKDIRLKFSNYSYSPEFGIIITLG